MYVSSVSGRTSSNGFYLKLFFQPQIPVKIDNAAKIWLAEHQALEIITTCTDIVLVEQF